MNQNQLPTLGPVISMLELNSTKLQDQFPLHNLSSPMFCWWDSVSTLQKWWLHKFIYKSLLYGSKIFPAGSVPVITKTKWQMVQCEDVASTKATFTFFLGGTKFKFHKKMRRISPPSLPNRRKRNYYNTKTTYNRLQTWLKHELQGQTPL